MLRRSSNMFARHWQSFFPAAAYPCEASIHGCDPKLKMSCTVLYSSCVAPRFCQGPDNGDAQ